MLYTKHEVGRSFAEMSLISSGQQWNKKITTWLHHKEEGRVCATHRQCGWDSDLTRIMLPCVSNDRPGQRVMQTNSCENLRMCRQTLFRPDICDIYHNRHCRSQIVVIVHSDLILFVVFFTTIWNIGMIQINDHLTQAASSYCPFSCRLIVSVLAWHHRAGLHHPTLWLHLLNNISLIAPSCICALIALVFVCRANHICSWFVEINGWGLNQLACLWFPLPPSHLSCSDYPELTLSFVWCRRVSCD